jgi:hypothetical protein
MSNALQRTAMLRAAHEANQTAILLQTQRRSHDATMRPATPAVPTTPALNRRRMLGATPGVPNTTGTLYRRSAPFDWGVDSGATSATPLTAWTPAHRIMMQNIPDMDNADKSSSDDSGHSDEDENLVCWKPCCSA